MPLPVDPNGGCPHPPGSPGKVEWYERRFENGWDMNHPQDATHSSAAMLDDPSMDAKKMSQYCELDSAEFRDPRLDSSRSRRGRFVNDDE
jgi:hypothetical protein